MRTSPTCIREFGRHLDRDSHTRRDERHRGPGHRLDGMDRGHRRHGGGPRARRGDVRLALLALLAEAPANGYSLIGQISDRTDGRWRPSPGSVYPVLRRLTEEGFVAAEEDDEKSSGYSITDNGRTFLAENSEKAAAVWENGRALTDGQEQLRQGLRKLMGATRELSGSGTEEQRQRTAELLDEARRKIYGMLAE